MPIRVPVALLVLAAGLTLGLVGVAVVGRDAVERPVGAGSSRQVPAERFALEVLHGWDRQRASAWAAGDPVALAALYARRSSAGAADVALLRRYAARGLSVRGLRMQLLRARVLVARPHRIVLEVTDRLTGSVAVRVAEATAARRFPDDTASTHVLALRRVGDRWLMVRVRPGASPR